jgi:hypothetical protein
MWVTVLCGSSRQLAQVSCPSIATNPFGVFSHGIRRRTPLPVKGAACVNSCYAASRSSSSSTTEILANTARLSARAALQTLARSRS